MYTLGIDIGSTTSKCIILKDGTEIAGKSIAGRRVYQLPEMYYDLSETEYSLFAKN